MDSHHDVPPPRHPVMVGVDGSPASLVAAGWAAQEARLRRAAVRVVYILPTEESTRGAEAILTEAVSDILQTHPDLAVDTMTVVGEVAQSLIDLTADCCVLVLGVDPLRSRSQHGLIGPLEERVAARAWCPTVWVSRRPVTHEHPQVLAIVPSTPAGMDVLAAAAIEADLRAAQLHVLIDPVMSDPQTDDLLSRAMLDIELTRPGRTIMIIADHPVSDDQVLDSARGSLGEDGERLALVILAGPHAHDRWSLRTGRLGPSLAHNGNVAVMYVGLPGRPPELATAVAGLSALP